MTPSNSITGVGDTVINGLERYVILEEIGFGKASVAYRVICKSGRLRNRHLVLKMVSSTSAQPHLNKSPPIHTTLHHPNVVSMFSAFYTSSESFHVLELCSMGSLSEFLLDRRPSTLLETELRGVVKSLVDALMYLKNEFVIHCNITPSKIFLTDNYGVKLSGFDHAIHLASTVSATLRRSGPSRYSAPEIMSGMPFSFPADIWSVGCVMIASVSGSPPFDANDAPDMFDRISQAEYTCLPGNLSADLRNLIMSVLQIKPEDRLSLFNIISHPFLAANLTIKSLRPTLNLASTDTPREQPVKLAPFPPKPAKPRRPARHSSIHPMRDPSTTRSVLRDIINTDLRNLLCSEITTKSPHVTGPTRRIVSDPIPRSANAMAAESRTHSKCRTSLIPGLPTSSSIAANLNEDSKSRFSQPSTPSLDVDHGSSDIVDATQRQTPGYMSAGIPTQLASLPVGTMRPIQFNILGLNSQTHKTAYGQVTILPSRALLVDFRESQRRKGFKGDEVILIGSDGRKISVYSAPHLSTPCCLVEPVRQFSVATLPSTYWKQYNDAGRLIGQIKQRTPKLVVYTAAAKCTLMANIPRGDIELSFTSPSTTSLRSSGQRHEKTPHMRIRFSRQCQFVELSQHVSGVQGEEWTKKSIPSTDSSPFISPDNWTTLEDVEKEAIQQVVHFVRTCEAVEGLLLLDDLPMSQTTNRPRAGSLKPLTPRLQTPPLGTSIAYSTRTLANSLLSAKVTRRPAKLSTTSTIRIERHGENSNPLGRPTKNDVPSENLRSTLNTIDPAEWCPEEFTDGNGAIETRFLPSVGWCIRYGSRVSQGGRFRVMFLDGVALDVDVDEDWAELRSQSGNATRYRIHDCGLDRKIGDRMKVFEEFISLFDDSQSE